MERCPGDSERRDLGQLFRDGHSAHWFL